MNCGFLDLGGMKHNHRKKTNIIPGSVTESDGILNDTTPLESAAEEVVSPFVVDETVRVAYLVVANYVKNTWGKYGLVRSMFSSSTGLFSFQFSSMDGIDAMLENGLCEDGLSAIAIKLGTPIMLDSYTSDMCMQSWGRSSYARAMIEFRANVELKDTIVNVDSSSPGTTLIIKKIDKLIIDEKVTLVDDEEKPLEKVVSSGDYDSADEVASVDNEMASFLAKEDGYGTQTLLEQWKESYKNDDNEYDPYDDDMYEGQEIPDKL
uniref:Uncharacterized protein n=1 Tax=Tanacetum cinerariifolium TaxID=118510 RepID=A0A699GZQ0_TANCI|nr:hypothetical protein [Tanacetum cinerariifolium]